VTTAELIAKLKEQGVNLWFEGERLRFRAPKGALTPVLRAELGPRKSEVLARLRAEAAASERVHPTSFSQRSLWLLHQQAPQSEAYHVGAPMLICDEFDAASLRQALQALVDRHAILRTTYEFVDGGLSQRTVGAARVAFETRTAAGVSDDELRRLVSEDFRQPFDLANGPVFRATLFVCGPERYVLLIAAHHIAVDAWSLLLLIQEMAELYNEATGRGAPAPSRTQADYADFVRWQEAQLDGPQMQRHWEYWQSNLAPPRALLNLPTDRPRSGGVSFRGASVPIQIDTDVPDRVKTIARENGTTPFVVLLAAFHAFLFRLTGQEDITVGTPTFARGKAEFLRTVGDFVNSLPLRGRIDAEMSFRDLIAQLRQTVLGAIEAQDFPFPLLVQRLQPGREAGRSPLFDVFFLFQRFEQFKDIDALLSGGASDAPIELGGLRLQSFPIPQQEGQFDLSLQLLERPDGYAGALTYRTDLFDEPTVVQFAADYVAALRELTANPEVLLGEPTNSTLALLFDQLRERDIRLVLDGDRLRVNAPKGAVDEAIRAAITGQKAAIVAALKAGETPERFDPPSISRVAALPVSAAQQRLWFLDRMEPRRALYNIGLALRMKGHVDVALLKRAIETLIGRHESLRTRIGERANAPWIEIDDASTGAIEIVDISQVPCEARRDLVQQQADAWLQRPFDLSAGPLARFLILAATDEAVLVICMHHAVSDGWSLPIAIREICTMYDDYTHGRNASLAPVGMQYVDYAAWEHKQMRGGRLARQLDYWQGQLRGAPALLDLPTDRPRPAAPSYRGARLMRIFDRTAISALQSTARNHGATFFMSLLTAWFVLMYRYSGQDDIVIGSPSANRGSPELEGVIGCLANITALRGRLDGNPTFAELLVQVKKTTLEALDNSGVPFDAVVERLNPERNASHTPIFQVLFTLMSFTTHVDPPDGLSLVPIPADTHASRFDLTAELGTADTGPHAGQFVAMYEYATDLFDEKTIDRLHSHFEAIIRAAAANPSAHLDELPVELPCDETRLLLAWNETGLDHNRRRCVHHLLEATARTSPEATAVVAADAVLSYGDLERRANQLAHLLQSRGIGPGDLVAVCLDRTADMPVVLAAILKAGAAYVPLDPTHPADRLQYVIADASVACTITLTHFCSLIGGTAASLLVLDAVQEELARQPDTSPAVQLHPEALAYVIYTSGSTGKPKGVQVEHRNVVSFLEAMRHTPGLTAADTLLAVTTLSFDIAGLEMWLPLSVGARTVIAPRTDVLDGEALIRLIDTHNVTMLQATPATWRLLLGAGWKGKRDLKALCGGEAMPGDLATALLGQVGELWNMYGPTETTIWSTAGRVSDAAAVGIGRPIANTRVYILDTALRPVPIGVAGELCIGGEGVARGYWKREELTRERFVTVVQPDGTAERVYRTGDVARFRRDGHLEYLGRRDQQVKIRGHRIELGEIEAVLAVQPGVKECVVAVRVDERDDPRLVGYVTLPQGVVFDAEAARAGLRARLPEYMVPNRLVVLPALPLTPNGKIDRAALPVAPSQITTSVATPQVLMSPTERRVADIWCETLKLDHVGLYDNFFDVGGHSLLLVKVHGELKAAFDSEVTLIELFQYTTVAAQADRIAADPYGNGSAPPVSVRAERQAYV
jgi:amino acid adenylation domain-containing protein